MKKTLFILLISVGLKTMISPIQAQTTTYGQFYESSITPTEWRSWSTAFLTPSGRVIDSGSKQKITHSEGQGYGMLLAYFANQPGDFERIWYFTKTEMQLRDDGLIAWKWTENTKPHIQDLNNATDGDMLVAYALVLAGKKWKNDSYLDSATQLIKAIKDNTLYPLGDENIYLKPGVEGFLNNGLVTNSSYWIYEALIYFSTIDSDQPWQKIINSGLSLLSAPINRPLPYDWIKISDYGQLSVLENQNSRFGYEALRIPLYLARANIDTEATNQLFERIITQATDSDGNLIINNITNRSPGYRSIVALLKCKKYGEPFPQALRQLTVNDYYSTTLQLMSIEFIRREFAPCLN